MMAEDPLPNYLRLNTAAADPGRASGLRAVAQAQARPKLASSSEWGRSSATCTRLAIRRLLDDIEIWSVGRLPIDDLPDDLIASIREKRRVVTIEEHYGACGLGEALSHLLLTHGVLPDSLVGLYAAGYPSGRYGSQRWHQEESGLAGPALLSRLRKAVHG